MAGMLESWEAGKPECWKLESEEGGVRSKETENSRQQDYHEGTKKENMKREKFEHKDSNVHPPSLL